MSSPMSSVSSFLRMILLSFALVRVSFSFFFFSSRRRHTRFDCDWSSDVCSSDLTPEGFHSALTGRGKPGDWQVVLDRAPSAFPSLPNKAPEMVEQSVLGQISQDRKSVV